METPLARVRRGQSNGCWLEPHEGSAPSLSARHPALPDQSVSSLMKIGIGIIRSGSCPSKMRRTQHQGPVRFCRAGLYGVGTGTTWAGGWTPPAHRSCRKALLFDFFQRLGGVGVAILCDRRASGGVRVERHFGFGQPCRATGGGDRRHAAALGTPMAGTPSSVAPSSHAARGHCCRSDSHG